MATVKTNRDQAWDIRADLNEKGYSDTAILDNLLANMLSGDAAIRAMQDVREDFGEEEDDEELEDSDQDLIRYADYSITDMSLKPTIVLADKTFKQYLSPSQVTMLVKRMAEDLNNRYRETEEKVIILVVLNGAAPFAMALLPLLDFDFELDFVKVSSYRGELKGGSLYLESPWQLPVKNGNVLIIEDIVDTGNTIQFLRERLMDQLVSTINTATLLFKSSAFEQEIRPRFIGKWIEDQFVVGYGMDYKGYGRGLAGIYQLVDKDD